MDKNMCQFGWYRLIVCQRDPRLHVCFEKDEQWLHIWNNKWISGPKYIYSCSTFGHTHHKLRGKLPMCWKLNKSIEVGYPKKNCTGPLNLWRLPSATASQMCERINMHISYISSNLQHPRPTSVAPSHKTSVCTQVEQVCTHTRRIMLKNRTLEVPSASLHPQKIGLVT